MSAAEFDVREDDLKSAATCALLELHLVGMHASSPPGSVYALDLFGLRAAEVTVWTAWRDERVASVGALKALGSGAAEVKSMRTHPDFLGQGAAAAVLDRILREAKQRGIRHLSLETGSGSAFEAALRLYKQRGFVSGPAFAGYEQTAFNQFLHMDL